MEVPEEPKELISRHWDQIKLLVLAKWDRIHESDLWDIRPSLHDLAQLIQKKYTHTPKESIIQELENLIFQYKT